MALLTAMILAILTQVFGAGAARAQETAGTAWIQLEALPDLTSAEERARDYATTLGNVAGFRIGSRWYLLTLGPFSATEAAGKLSTLKSAGQIPSDAYITDGADHGQQFWPVGAAAAASPEPAAVPAPETTPAADAIPADATPADAPQQAQPSDETLAQAQGSEAALSRDEKAALQAALQWYGFYQGALDGAYGRGTRGSMADWQTAMGYDPTGVLTTLQRATLLANYRADEASFAFAPVVEPEAGIEFSLPTALLEFDRYEPPFVHYAARDGSKLRLLLISEPGDSASLAGLYDLLQTLEVVPAQGERSVSDKSFTINASGAAVSSFATATASKGAIKGYLLVWEPAQADIAQRILAVMQGNFRSTGDVVLDPGLVPLDEGVKTGVLAGMAVQVPKARASGVYISDDGAVLTTLDAVAACGKITLDGSLQADLVAQDAGLGAAILRPQAPAAPLAVAIPAQQSVPVGTAVLVAGYSLATGLPAPVLTSGQVQAQGGPSGETGLLTLSAATTPYDLGGPVLDASGALLGIVFGGQAGGKSLPSGLTLARDMTSLAPLLAQAGVTPPAVVAADRLSPDALSAAAMGMTVQVACWP